MAWKNLFNKTESQEAISRIQALTPETQPQWGKMNAAQMLAHCNVAYELVYTDKHPKPKGFQKFLIKLFAKNVVVGPKPYKKNSRTAPVFLITDERDHMLLVPYQKMNGIHCFQSILITILRSLMYSAPGH